jgi:hypothetical protein
MRRQQPERRERLAFMRWVTFKPNIRKYLFAIENGGSRHPLEAANIKRCGLMKGVPDYCFMKPSGKYHAMYIEFKVKPNKITKDQQHFFDVAAEIDIYCCLVWNWEEAVAEIENYLKLGENNG